MADTPSHGKIAPMYRSRCTDIVASGVVVACVALSCVAVSCVAVSTVVASTAAASTVAAGMGGVVQVQSTPSIAMDSPTWRLESSDDGIALYSGSVPGTGIAPFKAVMTIPGTIEDVSLVLEDIPRRGAWISNYERSVLLERTNDYDQVEYLRVAMPWPVTDRSTLIRVRISVRDDLRQATIAAESVASHPSDTLPQLVRALVYASTFQMTQVDGHVEVATLVFIDPRGRIPKWVVNFFTGRVARATLSGLRRQVARQLYAPSLRDAMRKRMLVYRAYRQSGRGAP